MVVGLCSFAATKSSGILPISRKEVINIQANIERGFTLKDVRDMIGTYSQVSGTDKYSQKKSIIWPVWLNG